MEATARHDAVLVHVRSLVCLPVVLLYVPFPFDPNAAYAPELPFARDSNLTWACSPPKTSKKTCAFWFAVAPITTTMKSQEQTVGRCQHRDGGRGATRTETGALPGTVNYDNEITGADGGRASASRWWPRRYPNGESAAPQGPPLSPGWWPRDLGPATPVGPRGRRGTHPVAWTC